jgi:hypothetical protein
MRKVVEQAAHPLLMTKLAELIIQTKNDLRHCAQPTCPSFFLRKRKQRYCSEKCSRKARLTKHRQNKRVLRAIEQYLR